jgi:pyruvate kinase
MCPYDLTEIHPLIDELQDLRSDLLNLEENCSDLMHGLSEPFTVSARNLVHYVALRGHDLRHIQDRLAALGLSSLGRAEGCVLANLDAVLRVLRHLAELPTHDPELAHEVPSLAEGRALLRSHTDGLFGAQPDGRAVRIMVTMPSEAANDYPLVRDLVTAGMDCMRINCAHDGPDAWGRMIIHLRRAEREVGRRCRVLMDLPGPKLRTGPLRPGPQVLKWKPQRDQYGRVHTPARVWLIPEDDRPAPPASADASLPVPRKWLHQLKAGDRVEFQDARGSRRRLTVTEKVGHGCWAECDQTAYVTTGTQLDHRGRSHARSQTAHVGCLDAVPVPIVLRKGDTLVLTRSQEPGEPCRCAADGRVIRPAHIGCTLPEAFADLAAGEGVWLDDGKIGGIIRSVGTERVEVEITHADAEGAKLGADKGINFPDSKLRLPALTSDDVRDLAFIAAHADLVGMSFVHNPEDVEELQSQLARLGGQPRGIILKIETRRGFEQLPRLLLAAMRSPCAGVMIARGDLAVECGYERLAELQEEILWMCEAAHVPVIWATQVLEGLAKEGRPSRAEITDAAMSERAECVMLNKGPHIDQAVRVLDDILRRMQGHQSKKRSMLRPLKLADRFRAVNGHK